MHRYAQQNTGAGRDRILWASLLAGLFAIITNSAAEAAASCLSGPNGQASPGTRWHYRIEHPSQKRCWYMKQTGAKTVGSRSSAGAKTAAVGVSPSTGQTTGQSTDQSAGQSTIMARLSSAFDALRRVGAAPPPEPKTASPPETKAAEAPVRRRARVAKRFEPAKAPPSPPPDPAARAAAPSLDSESREALYQQFLQWRIRQLISPE